jgi:hypothetical protein
MFDKADGTLDGRGSGGVGEIKRLKVDSGPELRNSGRRASKR